MMNLRVIRRWAGLSSRSALLTRALGSASWTQRTYASSTESLPRVAQPSIWHSVVPKFLRRRKETLNNVNLPKAREWNPATFYIVMFLLIGSNAIQMIALRTEFTNFSRKADAKIGLLKEVLERVQRGEDVDVEGLLGTGNEEKEKEWADVLREIEEDEQLWQTKAEKKARKAIKTATSAGSSTEVTSNDKDIRRNEEVGEIKRTGQDASDAPGSASVKSSRRPTAFY